MVPVFDRRKLRPLILVLAIALCVFQLTTCTGAWLLDPLIVRHARGARALHAVPVAFVQPGLA